MSRIGRKRERNFGPLYSSPMALWFTLFFLAPLGIIIIYSFLKKGLYGGIENEFSVDAYRYLGDPVFLGITLRTVLTSMAATVITIFIALPCGYFMAKSRNQTLLLLSSACWCWSLPFPLPLLAFFHVIRVLLVRQWVSGNTGIVSVEYEHLSQG